MYVEPVKVMDAPNKPILPTLVDNLKLGMYATTWLRYCH